MSEAIPDSQNDFWRPPLAAMQPVPIIIPAVSAALVEACDRCESEFMVGARFCYVCGAVRRTQTLSSPNWTRYLEFNHITRTLNLPFASLIAFLAGLACLFAAAFVGMVHAIQSVSDSQAIQLWRMQWLLAAIAFFVAGILLKRTPPDPKLPVR